MTSDGLADFGRRGCPLRAACGVEGTALRGPSEEYV